MSSLLLLDVYDWHTHKNEISKFWNIDGGVDNGWLEISRQACNESGLHLSVLEFIILEHFW